MKLTILLIFSLSLSLGALSQAPDSLYQALKASDPHKKGNGFNDLAEFYLSTDLDSADYYINKATSIYDDLPVSADKARCYDVLSRFYNVKGRILLAEQAAIGAMDIASAIDSLNLEVEYASRLNERIYITNNQFEQALNTILPLKPKAQKAKNIQAQFDVNAALYQIYFLSKSNYDKQLTLAEENLALAKSIGLNDLLVVAHFDMALALNRNGKVDQAFDQYRAILNMPDTKENLDLASRIYNNMGSLFNVTGQTDSAHHYYILGFESAKSIGRTEGMAASMLKLGNLMGSQGDLSGAYDACYDALELFKEAGTLRRQDACLLCMYEASKGLGNYKDALKWYELSLVMKDSFVSSNTIASMKRAENQFLLLQTRLEDSIILAEEQKLNDQILKTKNAELDAKNAELKQNDLIQERDNYIKISLLALGVILLAFGFIIYKRYQKSQQQNQIIEQAHSSLRVKTKEITDSINYAKRIQNAVLPSSSMLEKHLGNGFVLYLPKDIVAGDFYWMYADEAKNELLFAVADCTGHGVPGAMVSVICNNGLNRSVREHGLRSPSEILDKTRDIVLQEFDKSDEDVKDGMDIALCRINGNELHYSGAHNPVWIIRHNNDKNINGDRIKTINHEDLILIEIKADKQPIGNYSMAQPFTTHTIDLIKGDRIYIFSDGYYDQFGGPNGKKLKSTNMKKWLLDANDLPIASVQGYMLNKFNKWLGDHEQIDDVCLIGYEFHG